MRGPHVVEFFAGSAEDIVVPLFDDTDAPVPSLAGWAGVVEVRHVPGQDPLLASWSSADGSLSLADSSARLIVGADLATESLGWTWRTAWFDLKLTTPQQLGSLPQRPIRGIMRVTPGIST